MNPPAAPTPGAPTPTPGVPAHAAPPLWEQHRAQIEAFRKAKVNYDPERASEYTAASGWRIDDYETELTPEAPGAPDPNGAWAAARDVLRDYKFPPPDLITGIFAPDEALEDRVMLIQGRFLGMSFLFGVRVGGVVDEERATPDGPERVWGYHYRTLEGHFEKGEITFTVHKQLTTGRVIFRVHAYSQPDYIRNIFYRIGFKIFGRSLQRKFARESMRRMKELVAEKLQGKPTTSAIRPKE